MQESPTDPAVAEFRSLTGIYLRQVRNCTRRLPAAVRRYGDDGFDDELDRLAAVESECDSTLAQLRTTVGESMEPNFSPAYLHASDVIELFTRIDDVANRSESFAADLAAMEPDLDDRDRASLERMAALTDEATGRLVDATERGLRSLADPGDGTSVTEGIDRIGVLESECDAVRDALLSAAFADGATAEALLMRELALSLDATMDAVEDAGDHLLYLTSRGP